MPTNIGSMGNKNKRTSTNNKRPMDETKQSAKTLSRKEKERKLLEELGTEKPGMNKRKKNCNRCNSGSIRCSGSFSSNSKIFSR